MIDEVICPKCNLQHKFSCGLIDEFICNNCKIGLKRSTNNNYLDATFYQDIPKDNSALEIGGSINYNNERYVIIGKVKFHFETTFASRWLLLNPQGILFYLFEYINGFGLTQKSVNTPSKSEISKIKPSKKLSLGVDKKQFQVKSIFQNERTLFCGEIENNKIDKENFEAIVLTNADKEFAFIQSSFEKTTTLFLGKFIDYHELFGDNINPKNDEVSYINCLTCKAPITNYLKGKTFSLVCGKCNSHFNFDNNNILFLKNKFNKKSDIDIPLGSKGVLDNKNYKIIGYQLKKEKGTAFKWKEYNLIDEKGKIVTLSEFNGHYNLTEEIDYHNLETINITTIHFNNSNYHLFNKYEVDLQSAEGEFIYQIENENNLKVTEFVAPPFIFFEEKNNTEVRYFHGKNITSKQVENAFELAVIPERIGTGATQTMNFGINHSILKKLCMWFLILTVAIQLFFTQISTSNKIFNQSFTQSNVNDSTKVLVSNTFQITDAPTVLQFDLVSNVDNNWFGVTIELINNNTGDRFEVDKTIEFYSGIDEGESWSEGEKSESVFMSQVPAGSYHLNLYPEWGSSNKETNNFDIWVYKDVPMWSNFFVILFVAAIFVIIHYIRFRIFESKRWMASNFDSPYVT